MKTATTDDATSGTRDQRILREGYGDGAWHGPDLNAALADVRSDDAFRRPASGRHNIAEIALHHAYTARAVRARLTGVDPEPFVLEGDDWFNLPDQFTLSWSKILEVVRLEQERLTGAVADIDAGRTRSSLSESERFDLVLGITCHAVYHAGQIQLIKRLMTA
jgi:hypothetical protein